MDVEQAIEIFQQHGRLKVLDEIDLVVETEDAVQLNGITEALSQAFGEEAWIEPIVKKRLE